MNKHFDRFNESELDKLNCMNYMVHNPDGHYYITDGIDGLKVFATNNKIDVYELCENLLDMGQVELDKISITMV